MPLPAAHCETSAVNFAHTVCIGVDPGRTYDKHNKCVEFCRTEDKNPESFYFSWNIIWIMLRCLWLPSPRRSCFQFVCLFVCQEDYAKEVFDRFAPNLWSDGALARDSWLDVGLDPGILWSFYQTLQDGALLMMNCTWMCCKKRQINRVDLCDCTMFVFGGGQSAEC